MILAVSICGVTMGDDKSPLEDWLKELMKKGVPSFHPIPWYNPEGDMIEVSFTEAPFYAEQVNVFLTIYRSQETNEIVGCALMGVDDILGLSIDDMVKEEEKGYKNKKYYLKLGDPTQE